MSKDYQVIARRWRPQSFSDLVGQENIVRILTNAIQSQRIAHAYLFVGPRGTGKTSTARLFSMALNCEKGPSIDIPSLEKSSICQSIFNGSSMDVIEIDGASNNSVEQIRDLREECQYAPAELRYKIYIIDEVHMLSLSAFNALLKTLEEPPAHVKFIFATTEAQKVPATILSRCQRLEFLPLREEVVVKKLEVIAKADKIKIEKAALGAIARLAEGGMRDAQSILEQIIAFCGKSIEEKHVLEVYGLAAEKDIEALTNALLEGNLKTTLETSKKLTDSHRDLISVQKSLLLSLHKHLLKHIDSDTESKKTLFLMESLQESLEKKVGLNAPIQFELALLRSIEQSKLHCIDSVIEKLSIPSKKKTENITPPPKIVEVIDSFETLTIVPDPEYGYPEPRQTLPPKTRQVDSNPLPPPPKMEEALSQLPKTIQKRFEASFRGKITGVWPVNLNKCL